MQAVKLCSQQNPPVLNSACWLTQVVLYNGHKTVAVVVVVVVVVIECSSLQQSWHYLLCDIMTVETCSNYSKKVLFVHQGSIRPVEQEPVKQMVCIYHHGYRGHSSRMQKLVSRILQNQRSTHSGDIANIFSSMPWHFAGQQKCHRVSKNSAPPSQWVLFPWRWESRSNRPLQVYLEKWPLRQWVF